MPLFNKDSDQYRIVGLVGSFGFTTAGAIAGGYFLGSYIDRKLNTSPWIMLCFILLGMVGSFIEFFNVIKKLSGKNERNNDNK